MFYCHYRHYSIEGHSGILSEQSEQSEQPPNEQAHFTKGFADFVRLFGGFLTAERNILFDNTTAFCSALHLFAHISFV